MMRHYFVLVLTAAMLPAVSVNVLAQSSDAAYPEGTWISELPAEEFVKPYYIEMEVKRVTEADKEHNGIVDCGYITVNENKTEKTILEGPLTYAGKGLQKSMSNGVYYFNVKAKSGRTMQLGVRKTAEANLHFVSLTGELGNHPFLKDTCQMMPLNGSWTPATIEPYTEKELLQSLKEALDDYDKDRIAHRTRGFGDVRQYIKAHQSLDPNLPKYAKPKGTAKINIRKERNTQAPVIGELPVGKSLLVVDEYDGWCQVRTSEKVYGWVSLSVVTLSNSKGVTATTTATQTKPAEQAKAAATPAAKDNYAEADLHLVELMGPVQKCVVGEGDAAVTYQFSREGKMLSSKAAWGEEIFAKPQRDKYGRITRYGDDIPNDMDGEINYHYVVWRKTAPSYVDAINFSGPVCDVNENFLYQNAAKPHLVTKKSSAAGGEYCPASQTTYTYKTFDKHGNWTQRIAVTVTKSKGEPAQTERITENRRITYYE